jgi:hypothetical protein
LFVSRASVSLGSWKVGKRNTKFGLLLGLGINKKMRKALEGTRFVRKQYWIGHIVSIDIPAPGRRRLDLQLGGVGFTGARSVVFDFSDHGISEKDVYNMMREMKPVIVHSDGDAIVTNIMRAHAL